MFYNEVPYVSYIQEDAALAKQGIELILSQNSLIESYSVLVCGRKTIIGVIPYPLYSRSQRLALEESIRTDIGQVYGFDEVAVSFDVDIVYEINKLNRQNNFDDKVVDDLIYTIKVRRAK